MTVFLLLFLAHLLGDFSLQPLSWIKNRNAKRQGSLKLVLHVLVHALLAWLLLWNLHLWWAVLALLLSHWAIDVWKTYQKDTLKIYLTDQALHLAVLIALTFLILPQNLPIGFFQIPTAHWGQTIPYPILVMAPAFLLMLRPTSMVVYYFMKKFDLDDPDFAALENAGKWIGYFERVIILMSVVMGAYSVLGFLVAAKSLLRFSDKKENRKHTEYVLVGSLLSWTIGIGIAMLAGHLMGVPKE